MASLLESFKNFCEEHPNFVDFELTDKSYLAEGVEGITILGQHGSASEICFWQINKNTNLEDNPLVWLDSEGSPRGVFASNLKEFLAILPYDTGMIYDVISKSDPTKYFNTKAVQMYLDMSKQNNGARLEDYLKWMEENDIALAKNPVEVIANAVKNNQKFPA